MADYNKSIDLDKGLNRILDRIDRAADMISQRSEEAGDAVGEGFDEGFSRSMRKIQASSIKLSGAFKNLSEKLRKDMQQLTASVNGKDLKLKIDFSDVDLNAEAVKAKIAGVLKSFSDIGIVEFDENGSKQYFENLIKLYVKYTEKLDILKKSQAGITDAAALTKNLQEQLVLANNIRNIYKFLDERTDYGLPIDSQKFHIQDLEKMLSAVSSLKEETKSVSGDGLEDIVGVLSEIKQAINDVRDAFKPLTDAFASEDSAIGKMVRSNVEDLNTLQSKFEEVFKNIETLSNKEFSNNTIIQQSAKTDSALSTYKTEARSLLKILSEVAREAGRVSSQMSSTGKTNISSSDWWTLSAAGDDSEIRKMMSDIKNVKDVSDIKAIYEILEERVAVVAAIVKRFNQIKPGAVDTSKLSNIKSFKQIDDMMFGKQFATEADVSEALDQVETLKARSAQEFDSLKEGLKEVFEFGYIDPNYAYIQDIIENIYQQFVGLQSKINALGFTISAPVVATSVTDSGEIISAADAIKREGEEADKASTKKDAFTAANQRVAESGSKTAAGVQEATDEIVEEGVAAERAADQIQEAYVKIQKSLGGKSVTVNGTSYEDFQNFAMALASGNNMVIDDVSVVADSDDNVKLATIKMVNEELAQSITYTYRLRDAEDESAEVYLEKYKASSNVNKAIKAQLAAQKRADAERKKADKEKAQNNQWLIQQQEKLDVQVRRYQNSSKKISGSTQLTSIDSSLADDADKTIDSLVQHIRNHIQQTSGEMLTDELREQILNDLRILKHEIGIEQSNQYSSTNMKAATVQTNKKAYEQYYEARDKQLKSYGKTEYNRETKYSGKLDGHLSDIGDGNEGQRLKKLVEQYRTTYQTIANLRTQFESDPASAEDIGLKTEFQQAVIHAERLRKEINGVFTESQKIKQAWQTSGIGDSGAVDANAGDISTSMIEYVNSLKMGAFTMTGFDEASQQMFGTLDKGNGVMQNITVALDRSDDSLYAWTTSTKRAADEWDEFKAKLGGSVKQLVGTYLGLHEAIQAVRSGLKYVKEIDLAMTELRKVTDEAEASYDQFLDTAASISSVIGSTISDFTNATAAFARLGYSVAESTKMAETAILYKNVADGLDTVDEATDSIISTMMAFGVQSNNTMSIIDKFNEVGNNFAITSAGIGYAMQRSASALFEAGNSIDESIALITAANSV